MYIPADFFLYMYKRPILPQILQIYADKRQFVVNVVLGFRLRKSAKSARDIGVSLCNRLSTLACYSPADSADPAEECSKLHYHAEKDSLIW